MEIRRSFSCLVLCLWRGAQTARRNRNEEAALEAALETARSNTAALGEERAHAEHALRQEVARQEDLVVQSRELAAGQALQMRQRSGSLEAQLASSREENTRLKRDLDESRENFARLSAEARETDERARKEEARLNTVVEKLGGESAEARHVVLARVETLSSERERVVEDLSEKLEQVTKERDETTAHLKEVVDKLRWIQSKALEDGSVRPGRYRAMMYWESMKNVHADEGREGAAMATSWRTDHDESAFSRTIAAEHGADRAIAGMRMRRGGAVGA